MGHAVAMGVAGSVGHVFGAWGPPPDDPARVALACAGVALVVALLPPRLFAGAIDRRGAPPFVATCAFVAAALSLGYVAYYLRGAPRIVDATSYWLQGRALSEGHFAWHVPEPSASFRGRFELARDGAIAGIFPPGYPLLLSIGFAVGAPMVVGPALAAAIVFATAALARTIARDQKWDPAHVAAAGNVGAALSVASAALRYHTADTMAHGACALAFAIAIRAALRAGEAREGEEEKPWFFLIAGLALGFVASARFASALALGAVLAWLALRSRSRATALVACALGALPGLALLAIAQQAATGSALASTQAAYYAASDGPPGCFRYGFGASVGCLVEHGDFVRAGLSSGFGAKQALFTTLRRLAYHLGDVANLEPLALLALVPVLARPARAARACLALVAALVLAYAPFYFDGDYPGGGARFFADAIPIEHALVAIAIALLAARARVAIARAALPVVALSLGGFAVHAAYAHDALRDRDGGRPMFEPETLARAHVTGGSLVFVETDHGFALGHDPAAAEQAARRDGTIPEAPIVARLRDDDHDRLLYERLGRPRAWVYRFREKAPETLGDVASGERESIDALEPWNPILPPLVDTWRFEAENEWPPLAQHGGAWAEPQWASGTCASAGRALAVHADAPGDVVIDLPIPHAGAWRITPRLFASRSRATVEAGDATWTAAPITTCVDLPAREITTSATHLPMTIRCPGPCDLALDLTTLAAPPSSRPR